jgi:hypothetical protein
MTYTVTFTQYWTYDVEARTTEEAEEKAYEHFLRDMYRPIAITTYDDVEVDPDYDEEDEDEEEANEQK